MQTVYVLEAHTLFAYTINGKSCQTPKAYLQKAFTLWVHLASGYNRIWAMEKSSPIQLGFL